MIRVTISGAAGRMGCRLVAIGSQDKDLQIVGAVESPSHGAIGSDAGAFAGVGAIGVLIQSEYAVKPDVIIDFSTAAGADVAIAAADRLQCGLVMATTGLHAEQKAKLEQLAKKIPIVWSPSMSLTVNVTMKLCEIAATAFRHHPQGVDVEIIERHHRFKKDSPSGTALRFGQIIADVMKLTAHRHGRVGDVGERPHNEVGYHAVRAGDNPGEHTIIFGLLGETVELNVAASNRDCYAIGAHTAAKWLQGKSAGMYSMYDVLGI
jgi:4-hydroxy-tetrahydrodipicolinate reductase